MDIEDCNGRGYISGSGDSSMDKEFSGAMGPTVSTPNSQHSSPSRSLSANSIKVEMYSDEEAGRLLAQEDGVSDKEEAVLADESLLDPLGFCEGVGQGPHSPGGIRLPNGKLKCDLCGMVCIGPNVLMVHKRSHTGERPFHCNQCGASFTQKGNLLRHIKLHSGEKPFKCPFCNYACRRRDALSGHLRTHAGCLLSSAGEESRDMDVMPDHILQPAPDRPSFIDRLAHSIAKRKRSTPQKFVGDKHMRLNLSDVHFEMNSNFEKDVEMMVPHVMDPSLGGALSFLGSEAMKPPRLPVTSCVPEITPVISAVYSHVHPIQARGEAHGSREAAEGHEDVSEGGTLSSRAKNQLVELGVSPSNGCHDSTDTESSHEDRHAQTFPSNYTTRQSPAYSKEDPKAQEPRSSAKAAPSSAKEVLRVLNEDGEKVKAYKCDHCRVLFLDHVMFTIHMGCHGFRDPFECNICGHHSQDRYEFSSHIVRGEHKVS
ncbi:zinc finger protein Eos isoform X1 [Callorhinchus milii]|uniref:zinc finger protein Eos isoform X1 n=1 Tax=Callorhinchus milii TaxID=7868 RepID=UPI0004572A1B|nr:zinc finger protein Eos isoform X1 [Callorhinchus milii]|eukprot:gi/632985353/ref/XP_007909634.1/ PREDICTED: zinc finger protein Eos [Callorhinchus milii]